MRVKQLSAVLAAVISSLMPNGCDARRERSGVGAIADSAVGDSAYQAKLRNWRRDSVVLDSVTREINTAKLYALYRQALGREGVTLRLMTELACEEVRLGRHYGIVAWQRASKAVRDTVYRDLGETDGLAYIARHAPSEGGVETGENCRPLPPRAPQKIGETRLDVEFPRPWPGKAPTVK